MGDSLQNALDNVVAFLPKLLLFLIILAIGWFIAKALEKVLVKVLEKVGFDRAVERGGIKRALQNSQYDASQILAKIVFYAVMLFVLSTAFGVFGQNPISDYLAAIIGYLPKVFVAILILVIAAAIAAGVRLLVQNSLGSLSYGRLLATVASTVVLALGVIAALDQLEIAQNVVNAVLYATLAALVGVIVVAVGGGGIAPMRGRWENALAKVEAEAPNMRREAQAAKPAGQALREQTEQYRPQGQSQPQGYGEQGYGDQSYGERSGASAVGGPQQYAGHQHPVQQYGGQQYGGQQAPAQPYGGQQYGGQHGATPQGATQQPYDQEQGGWAPAQQDGPVRTADAGPQGEHPGEWAPTQQYGDPQTQSYGEQSYGEQQYGEQQYGQPQPYSTGAVPVPNPQQAYDEPPAPARRDDDYPGTQQLPRVDPGEGQHPR